jgi:hypothetical protein
VICVIKKIMVMWLEMLWGDAVYQAMQETGLEDFELIPS